MGDQEVIEIYLVVGHGGEWEDKYEVHHMAFRTFEEADEEVRSLTAEIEEFRKKIDRITDEFFDKNDKAKDLFYSARDMVDFYSISSVRFKES